MPKSRLRFKSSVKALNYVMLLDVIPLDLARLAIQEIYMVWMMQPIPIASRFPLEARTKFNFYQLKFGGPHLKFTLACLLSLG